MRIVTIIPPLPRKILLGIYIYNGVKSEKHALFQNPVSELELTSSKGPSKAFRAAELLLGAPGAPRDLQALKTAFSSSP